jgi:hypothetical protein
VIAIAILIFLIGYIIGRSRKFYLYSNGKLFQQAATGVDTFQIYSPKTQGFMVDLFGMDYNEGVVTPIYRPLFRFIRGKNRLIFGFRIGDFHECAVWASSLFPFLGAGYKNLRDEELYHAR